MTDGGHSGEHRGSRIRINLLPVDAGETPDPLGVSAPDDDALALQVARRVHVLPEAAMRGAVLSEQLLALPIPRAAAALSVIVRRGRQGGPPYALALAALEELLRTGRLPYETLSELYRELKLHALGEAASLLLPGRDPRIIVGEPAPRFPGGRELTLGERMSLARGAPRETIARLLRDPEPMVIRLLLGNPRLLERDLVFLASRRPIGPEVVREILGAPRWSQRYAVRRTLALNPTTPNEVALRLLPLLTRPHLQEVAEDPALPAVRQEAAKRLLSSP